MLGKIGEFDGLELDYEKISGASMRAILSQVLKKDPNDAETCYHASSMITV